MEEEGAAFLVEGNIAPWTTWISVLNITARPDVSRSWVQESRTHNCSNCSKGTCRRAGRKFSLLNSPSLFPWHRKTEYRPLLYTFNPSARSEKIQLLCELFTNRFINWKHGHFPLYDTDIFYFLVSFFFLFLFFVLTTGLTFIFALLICSNERKNENKDQLESVPVILISIRIEALLF